MPRKVRAKRARRVPGEMNKTEAAYLNEVILPKMESGEILSWEFERVTLKLAKDTRYTPDFSVVLADWTMEFYEVKAAKRDGKMLVEDDANVKIKVAADVFQCFGFVMCGKLPKCAGGGWVYKNF